MIEIKNEKEIIIVFAIIAAIFFLYSDNIVQSLSSLSPWALLFIAVLLNPVYLLLIYSLGKTYGLRGAIAGFLISTASDLISLPHVLLANGSYSQVSFNLITDTNFYNLIPHFLRFNISLPVIGQVSMAVFLTYIIISIGLVILALMIAKKKRFKEIFWKAI